MCYFVCQAQEITILASEAEYEQPPFTPQARISLTLN